jgi:hypothetical protein
MCASYVVSSKNYCVFLACEILHLFLKQRDGKYLAFVFFFLRIRLCLEYGISKTNTHSLKYIRNTCRNIKVSIMLILTSLYVAEMPILYLSQTSYATNVILSICSLLINFCVL